MGKYLKMMKYMIPGIANKYINRLFQIARSRDCLFV